MTSEEHEIPVGQSDGDDKTGDDVDRAREDANQDSGQSSEQESVEEARLYDIALRLARAGMLDELSHPRKSRRPPPAPWRPRTCQWIAGAPVTDDGCKCGRPVVPGRSYCPAHLARVYLRWRCSVSGDVS